MKATSTKYFYIAKEQRQIYFRILLLTNMLLTVLTMGYASSNSFSFLSRNSKELVKGFLDHDVINKELNFAQTIESIEKVVKNFKSLSQSFIDEIDSEVKYELQYTLTKFSHQWNHRSC